MPVSKHILGLIFKMAKSCTSVLSVAHLCCCYTPNNAGVKHDLLLEKGTASSKQRKIEENRGNQMLPWKGESVCLFRVKFWILIRPHIARMPPMSLEVLDLLLSPQQTLLLCYVFPIMHFSPPPPLLFSLSPSHYGFGVICHKMPRVVECCFKMNNIFCEICASIDTFCDRQQSCC